MQFFMADLEPVKHTLKTKADLQGGHLKYHVRVLWDETCVTVLPDAPVPVRNTRSPGITSSAERTSQ